MQGDYKTDKEAYDNGYDHNFVHIMNRFWSEPTDYHEQRYSFVMDISRGCSDDFRTHITLSSMSESSRFCNYSKGKFSNELTFIKPYWFEDDWEKDIDCMNFYNSMKQAESEYMKMASLGLQAQQLKRIFPLGAKCELRLCGFQDAWDNFFWRRIDAHADPECQKVAKMIKELM